MDRLIAEAIELRNRTPFGMGSLWLARQDHVEFLLKLKGGKL